MAKPFVPVHQHLLIRAYTKDTFREEFLGKVMLLDIVETLGMEAVTAPQCVYIDTPGNEGLTGSINLATSHVAFHMWDSTGLIMADVYSCCPFNVETILDLIQDYTEYYEVHHTTIDRSFS